MLDRAAGPCALGDGISSSAWDWSERQFTITRHSRLKRVAVRRVVSRRGAVRVTMVHAAPSDVSTWRGEKLSGLSIPDAQPRRSQVA